jgi:hypothetical protein
VRDYARMQEGMAATNTTFVPQAVEAIPNPIPLQNVFSGGGASEYATQDVGIEGSELGVQVILPPYTGIYNPTSKVLDYHKILEMVENPENPSVRRWVKHLTDTDGDTYPVPSGYIENPKPWEINQNKNAGTSGYLSLKRSFEVMHEVHGGDWTASMDVGMVRKFCRYRQTLPLLSVRSVTGTEYAQWAVAANRSWMHMYQQQEVAGPSEWASRDPTQQHTFPPV